MGRSILTCPSKVNVDTGSARGAVQPTSTERLWLSIFQPKIGDKRKVVGCNDRLARPAKYRPFQTERVVEIHMVKVEEWEKSGIGPASAEMNPNVHTTEVFREEPGRQTWQPFVEIAEKNARADDVLPGEYVGLNEPPALMSTLPVGGSQVDVVHVEHSLRA
jgi:hypothetical protein